MQIPYYALPTFNTQTLQPHSVPTSVPSFFFFLKFCSFAVTRNLTTDDGLEVELDKTMASFVRSFVRRRRFAPTPTPCSYTRLILLKTARSLARLVAVLLAASRRRRSNDTSLLELGFGRSHARLFADADFIVSRM
jgi:hypothetical protein